MQWHGFRVSVVILALLAGLVVFLGGQWLYNRYSFEQPLDQAIRGSASVDSFEILSGEPVLKIQVTFKDVENLRQSYLDLQHSLDQVLGKREYKLEVQDKRDGALDEFGRRAGFALYEAVERGNYRGMEGEILSLAGSMQVTVQVYIDQENIYVQAKHGTGYYYQIVPRQGTVAKGSREEGSGTR